ncbi:MAG: O-antigen polymerase [Gemmatimonas sp.]
MIWWYGAFVVALYAGVSLVMRSVDASWRRLYHPWVIIGGLNLAYTLTPLSSPVIREEQQGTLESFLLMQLIGLLGLAAGSIAVYGLWPDRNRGGGNVTFRVDNETALRLTTLTFLGLWLLTFQIYEGGVLRVITSGYLIGQETSGGDVILYAITTYPLLALISISYFVRGPSWEIVVAGGLFAVLNLLGGHRNLTMMEIGALLAVHSLRAKRPSYPFIFIGGFGGFLFLMIVGIYRNLGADGLPILLAIIEQDGLRVFDPSSQELGTSFNVYRIYHATFGNGFENWWPGESYVRAFLSTIPRQLWPDRPIAIADYFSKLYAGEGLGLGFSFNLEAYVNFGVAGVFLAMFALGFIATAIFVRQCSQRLTLFGLSFYATIVFISFNLNRIDFQTVLKIGALLAGSQYIVLRAFTTTKPRAHARAPVSRPALNAPTRSVAT